MGPQLLLLQVCLSPHFLLPLYDYSNADARCLLEVLMIKQTCQSLALVVIQSERQLHGIASSSHFVSCAVHSAACRRRTFLGLQIGSGVWAEGVPDIALTSANVQRPHPSDILHCFEFKQN